MRAKVIQIIIQTFTLKFHNGLFCIFVKKIKIPQILMVWDD